MPNAEAFLVAEQYPSLAELSQKLAAAADYAVSLASAEWPEDVNGKDPDKYAVGFAQLRDKFGIPPGDGYDLTDVLLAMIQDHPEIAAATFNRDEFLVNAVPREIVDKTQSAESTPDAAAPALSSDARELAAWLALTESNPARWREDSRFRQCRDGAFYYLGGENGQYMRLTNDGELNVGTYESAKPGSENAVLTHGAAQVMGTYEMAVLLAAQLGGDRFLSDLDGMPRGVEADAPQAKPSVLKQIREAQRAPKPPHREKAPGKNKGDIEI
jgi:hypothetical protein